MTTIHDTIYPRLKTIVSPQDLERMYTPTPDECALAVQVAQDEVAYLGFLIYLKTFQRLGYFVRLPSVPDCIVQHIARSVERTEHIGALAAYDHGGTSRRHQARIRAYRGVKPFRDGGRALIEQVVATAAMQTEQLADLINIAIEELLRHYYELPGFTTLLKVAQKQRANAYTQLYTQVNVALTPETTALLDALFVVDPLLQRSRWDWLKDPSGKPTLTNLKATADRLAWLVAYRPLMVLVEVFPEAKRRHFAAEARAYDITTMTDIKPPRRYTLCQGRLTFDPDRRGKMTYPVRYRHLLLPHLSTVPSIRQSLGGLSDQWLLPSRTTSSGTMPAPIKASLASLKLAGSTTTICLRRLVLTQLSDGL